jgi:anaerobic ribonucleoside-triphosphate reductase
MQVNMSLIPEFENLWKSFNQDPVKKKFLKIEGIAEEDLDIGLASEQFFKEKLANISTDANSNYSENMNPTVYRTHTTNGMMKLLGYHLLWHYAAKRYGIEWANMAISEIWNGGIYFHDAHGLRIQMPYCYAFSLDKLVFEGRPYGSSPTTPAKHRKSFLSQVDKLISDLSKQFAGATAPSDLFLWYSWYLKNEFGGIDWHDHIDDMRKEIIDDMQGLVCLFNEPGRAEGEPPFTNISIYDPIGLRNLFGHITFPDGTKPDFELIMFIQKTFCEWFSHGDPITGFPYRFPVVTINTTTTKDHDFEDEDWARWVAHVDRNMCNFNLHFGDRSKIAMCCRYENDLDDMNLSPDSFGNGGVNIGSHRVVTPNFVRCALKSGGDPQKFLDECDRVIDIAGKLLYIHRVDILQKRIDKNPEYLQFFGKLGWFSLDTMFSTIGLTGVYEVCQYMGYNILDDDGTEFTTDFMVYLKGKVKELRAEYGCVFNCEEIPGEQACVSLLNKDHIYFEYEDMSNVPDDVKDAFANCKLYSNQYIPLINQSDMITRLDLSGRFMKMISGGGVVHVNCDAQIDTDEKMYELIKYGVKCGVSHFAVCYRFGKCDDHPAVIVGQSRSTCPVCGKPITRTRARVIGYFSDENNWHPVRQKFDAPYRFYSNGVNLE